jgi:hypothetical protein
LGDLRTSASLSIDPTSPPLDYRGEYQLRWNREQEQIGRPPKVTDDALVEALQQALDWPTIAAVDTAAVAAILDVNQQTVRNRLKAARSDETASIGGDSSRRARWLGLVAHRSRVLLNPFRLADNAIQMGLGVLFDLLLALPVLALGRIVQFNRPHPSTEVAIAERQIAARVFARPNDHRRSILEMGLDQLGRRHLYVTG